MRDVKAVEGRRRATMAMLHHDARSVGGRPWISWWIEIAEAGNRLKQASPPDYIKDLKDQLNVIGANLTHVRRVGIRAF